MDKGFYESNLSELLTVCEELLQENENSLLIFTLKGLFQDLYCFHNSPPVTIEKEQILTSGLKAKILELLNNTNSVSCSVLEGLISLYQSNKAKLKAM